jgi:hypothetical protein
MTLVVGVAVDHLGLVTQSAAVDPPAGAPHPFEVRHHFAQVAGSDVATEQSPLIPVDVEHRGPPVGVVQHVERDPRGSVWACAWLEDHVDLDQLRYFSVLARSHGDRPWRLDSVALTARPAMTNLPPLHVLEDAGDVRQLSDNDRHITRVRKSSPFAAGLLERAARTARDRRPGDPVIVAAPDPPKHYQPPGLNDPWPRRQSQGRASADGLWHARGRILSVR